MSDRIHDQFNEYHAANPGVYEELRALALTAKRHGTKRLGIELLFNVIRWERVLAAEYSDGFKINNNFKSYYARMLMEREPELDGFFELRQRAAA